MEQLIYIEQNDKNEASKLSRGFAVENTKSRAYINALGTELAMKYLAQEDISVSNIYNLHNINKIREEFDVADVMLPNIHIDVRMVYDENLIFIPKSHFEYGLAPDIYLVFNMSENASYVKFLGFFEPKLINKNNKNDNYYFIEKEKLSQPSDLKSYIENFDGNTTESLPENVIEDAQKLALSFIDNDITESDKKKLINMLAKSSSLREEMIEFDNFEWISYHAIATDIFKEESADEAINEEMFKSSEEVDEFDLFDAQDEFETPEELFDDELAQEQDEVLEDVRQENAEDENLEQDDNLETKDISQEALEEEVNGDTSEILDILLSDEPMEDLPDEFEESLSDGVLGEEILENVVETLSFDNINFDEPFEETDREETEHYEQNTTDFADIQPIEELVETDEELTQEVCSLDEIEHIEEPTVDEEIEEVPETASFDELGTIEENAEPKESEIVETVSFNEMETVEQALENNNDTEETEYVSNIEELLANEASEETLETMPEMPQAAVYENSTTITNFDENFKAGEISIDINQNSDIDESDDYEKLEVLYNDNKDILNDVDQNIKIKATAPEKGKKAIFLATAIITALALLLIYASVHKTGNEITDQNNSNILEKNIPAPEEMPDNVENIMPNAGKPKLEDVAQKAQENINQPKAPAIESPYIDVKKLGWAIPDYISYNDSFKKYLQNAGQSLKLTLSSDLLLATEYAYSNTIQVDITLSKEGTIQSAKIAQSSGSTQIDNIVLRTVKETLNVVKAPAGVIIGDNIHLILKIYL